MSEIFISYARSTETYAQTIEAALRGLGYAVWRDSELPAHRPYAQVIDERLRAADAVVVIWSAEAAKSQWVRAEADVARHAGTLIQVSIDGVTPPLPFGQIQCADLSGWSGDPNAPGWRKVTASVRDLMGDPAEAINRSIDRVDGSAAEPLLAVLAFDNLSGDPDMAYFSDGVSEEILQTVARGAELKVIGRSSSFQFRGALKAARQVSAALKATHVLDGSVRRSGGKVRIAANLIECVNETTIWSDRFDRDLSDVLALQDEIATAVAAALKVAFAPAAPARPIDPLAYNLYLQALEIRNRGLDQASLPMVIEKFEEVTRLAPAFARAWAQLAACAAESLDYDQPARIHAATRAKVAKAAQTALGLDPGLGAALQALGQLKPVGCFADREALHRQAVSVAPNDPTVLTNASLFFAEVGRLDAAREFAGRAYVLDPAYPWAVNWYASLLGDIAFWEKLSATWPDNELIAWNVIASAIGNDDWQRFDNFVAAAADRKLDSPMLRIVIGAGVDKRQGGPEVRARWLAEANDWLARTGSLPIPTFCFLSDLGLTNDAFDLFGRSTFAGLFDDEQRSVNGAFGSSGLFFNAGLMSDIRFVAACAKLGLVDYWLKSEQWPDCAKDDVLPYDFKAECRRLVAT